MNQIDSANPNITWSMVCTPRKILTKPTVIPNSNTSKNKRALINGLANIPFLQFS